MHGKNQEEMEENTEFSEHVTTEMHTKEDLQYNILGRLDEKGIKKTIHIWKNRPNFIIMMDATTYHLFISRQYKLMSLTDEVCRLAIKNILITQHSIYCFDVASPHPCVKHMKKCGTGEKNI